MAAELTALEREYAAAVVSLTGVLRAEADRLATKGPLTSGDTRALADIAHALAALRRGPLWNARLILERDR